MKTDRARFSEHLDGSILGNVARELRDESQLSDRFAIIYARW